MLNEITIENVAVIENATAVFTNGFNVLTGETGAGKSILIDSINAILGARTSRDIVRSGAERAKIWAKFTNFGDATKKQLEDAGYSCDDELLLYREIFADGGSNSRINGAPATATMLREVCTGLVQIHGQHDNQNLMNPATHIDVIDTYAKNSGLLTSYQSNYKELRNVQKQIQKLSVDAAEKNRKIDLLEYEINEIDSAHISGASEEEELTEKRNVIRNAKLLQDTVGQSYQLLSGGESGNGTVMSLLSQVVNLLGDAAAHVDTFAAHHDTLSDIYYTIQEMAIDIQGSAGEFDFAPTELDELEQRLDTLYRLRQKYGATLKDVINYGERAKEELENITFSDQKIEALEKEEKALFETLSDIAKELSDSRLTAFNSLEKKLQKALEFLNMPDIRLSLQHKTVDFTPNGTDEIEFYIATNPGEAPKPLAKTASGGELSRIMLALKSVLAEQDELQTVIYDEIDAGVSGLAAGRIGQMLQETSAGRQVICVTHTAQIASYASQHLLINKRVEGGRTYTDITKLDDNQRIQELARIISGDQVTDLALANAEEMLTNAAAS